MSSIAPRIELEINVHVVGVVVFQKGVHKLFRVSQWQKAAKCEVVVVGCGVLI